MRKIALVAAGSGLLILGAVQPGQADGHENAQIARNLGSIMGGSEHCGLQLDQNSILTYIDQNVDRSDLGFPSSLNAFTFTAGVSASSWSGLNKEVQCRAVENAARANGFLD